MKTKLLLILLFIIASFATEAKTNFTGSKGESFDLAQNTTKKKNVKKSTKIKPKSTTQTSKKSTPTAKTPEYSKEENLLYNKGVIAAESGDFETALLELDSTLALNPRNIYALYARATVYFQLGKFKPALDDLEKLFKVTTPDEKSLYLYAIISQQFENYSVALQKFEELIKIDPKNPEYYFAAGYCSQVMGKPDAAINYYTETEKFGEPRNEAILNLAMLHYQVRNFDKALEYISKAITKKIANADIYSVEVYCLLEKNNCAEALAAFNLYADSLDNPPRILMNLGICYLNNKDYLSAETLFAKSFESDSSIVENIFNIAVSKLRNKKYEEALIKFQEFMTLAENRPDLEKQKNESKEQIEYLKEEIFKKSHK